MKMFTAVFLAIIAAVIAMIGVFFLIRPFLQYNEAKRLCLAEIDSALADTRDLSGGPEARLAQLNSSLGRFLRAEQALISVLAHKPLSLPLTSKERKLLSQAKSEIRKDTLYRLKNAFESYKVEYGDYPSGTPTEILKALECDNPNHFQFFEPDRTQLNHNGELVDPDGKPYPLEFSQIESASPTLPRTASPSFAFLVEMACFSTRGILVPAGITVAFGSAGGAAPAPAGAPLCTCAAGPACAVEAV